MNILGISCYYHDSAAALLKDGILVAAAEEERFSRVKHDARFPAHAISFCLRQGGIQAGDIDHVVFYEKPLVKLERILMTSFGIYPKSWKVFREGTVAWLKERLWIKDQIVKTIGVSPDKILFVEHHVSHAASAFFCSPFSESAILTVDGVGEWATATMGKAAANWDGQSKNTIELTQELRFPHSLGLLYSVFTAFLGFEVNEGEYKVMGMAPYGQPKYLDEISKIVDVSKDGSIALNMDYFSYQHSINQSFSQRFLDLFGEPRSSKADFFVECSPEHGEADCKKNQRYADIAASIQRFTEDVLIKMANHLHATTGLTKLCMAGGVALNSVANGRILRETSFKDIFIQPAAGDSGAAVGAALYVWHVVLGKPRTFILEDAYLGEAHDDSAITGVLQKNGIHFQSFVNDEDSLIELISKELQNGKVVGWFDGRFEWGPRALGNRSILADPRKAEMKEIVNSKIKFREPFRPFAPVILEEKLPEYFDGISDPQNCYPARYMLMVLPWKESAGDRIPAVNHMGTGRVQTIRREWNPRYYKLIENFGESTGIPVLMNTSFNLRGEPIVASPADALNTFSNSGIDMLVLGNYLVRK